MYDVLFSSSSKKYIKKTKDNKLVQSFKKAILQVQENPYIGQQKHGNLSGIYCVDFIYKMVNYEIAYKIVDSNEKRIVVVVLIGTRENFYKQLARFI